LDGLLFDERHRRARYPVDLDRLRLVAALDQGFAHRVEVLELRVDRDAVVVGDEVLGAGLDGDHGDLVRVELAVALEADDAARAEDPADGAGLTEVAAAATEGGADLRYGAIPVVGHRLNQHRGAAGAVAL